MSSASSNSNWRTESLEPENFRSNDPIDYTASRLSDENHIIYPRGSSDEDNEESIEKGEKAPHI